MFLLWRRQWHSISVLSPGKSMDRGVGCMQSMGSLRVGHDCVTSFWLFTFMHWRRQWQPTPVLLPGKSHGWRNLVGCSPWGRWGWMLLSDFTFTFHFHTLEKEMATHSSVLAWRFPGLGKPGGLPSMGSHRVGHDRSDLAAAACGFKSDYINGSKKICLRIICDR